MSSLPIVLITGQLLTDAVWQPLLDAWPDREVTVADNRSDDTIEGFAQRLLDNAPPKFALVGHAMGGFVAFEVTRRAPGRVAKLALISTLASADGPAQRSVEHTSELQSLMRTSSSVLCFKKKKHQPLITSLPTE